MQAQRSVGFIRKCWLGCRSFKNGTANGTAALLREKMRRLLARCAPSSLFSVPQAQRVTHIRSACGTSRGNIGTCSLRLFSHAFACVHAFYFIITTVARVVISQFDSRAPTAASAVLFFRPVRRIQSSSHSSQKSLGRSTRSKCGDHKKASAPETHSLIQGALKQSNQ